jgi:hypothetical protein
VTQENGKILIDVVPFLSTKNVGLKKGNYNNLTKEIF